MSKKCKCPPTGAPEWVLTYGDMMSLLLCFFILIVSMSEIKKEDQWKAVVEEIKEAFGTKGGGGTLPTDEDPSLSLIEVLEHISLHRNPERNRSNTTDPGMEGREPNVTQVREGMRFVVGGRITFEPGSADLTDRAKRDLRQVAGMIRGYNNLVELRGHAATLELAQGQGRFEDLWALSYVRAKAAMAYLTSDEVGIRRERIRLVANADREPLAQRAYTATEQEPNRRVEVVVVEALVQQFTEPEPQAGGG